MFHSPRHGRIQMAIRVRTNLYIQCKKKLLKKSQTQTKTKQLRFDVIYHLQQKCCSSVFLFPFQSSSMKGCNKTTAFYFYWVVTLSSQVWAWIFLRHSSFIGFHPWLYQSLEYMSMELCLFYHPVFNLEKAMASG